MKIVSLCISVFLFGYAIGGFSCLYLIRLRKQRDLTARVDQS